MEISAAMNIHDLAMNQKVQQQTDVEKKKDQAATEKDINENINLGVVEKNLVEKEAGFTANEVHQQEDLQALSIRVERQSDTQAAKEAVDPSKSREDEKAIPNKIGSMVDIIT